MDVHPLASLALIALFAASLAAQKQTGFLDRTVKSGGLELKYQVYVPPTYDGHRALPVILFMHGSGERGSDGIKQTQIGMPSQIRWHRDWFDAIVVMPQCPDDSVFRGAVADAVYAALEKSIREFHGDRERVYATGLSMGGYGTWQQLIDHPGVFAAAATVSGGLTPSADMANLFVDTKGEEPFGYVAARVKNVPLWIFHGEKDQVVPVIQDRTLVDSLRAMGASPRYTEYPEVGHGAWDQAYADEELWKWLFAQRLVKPSR